MATARDLTTAPIPGLIRRLAVPAGTGFFFNTLYNVVDSIYAGMWSTEALAALAISFPIFFLIIASSAGFGQGTTALIANALGSNDERRARHLFAQSLVLAFGVGILLPILALSIADPVLALLGNQETTIELALDYLIPIMLGSVLFLLNSGANAFLTADGDTKTYRNALIAGTVLNVGLDPLFMFVFGLGVAGIAWATVLVQTLIFVYLLYVLRRTVLSDGIRLRRLMPEPKAIGAIVAQGLPAAGNLMMIGTSLFVITYFVSRFGDAATAAYGVALRIEQLFLLPTVGLNASSLALVGQNFGAKKFDRVREIYAKTLTYGLAIMASGGLIIMIFRGPLMGLFTDDPDVIDHGSGYLFVAALIQCAYALTMIGTSTLQGMTQPMPALVTGLFRSLIAPPLFIWLALNALGTGIDGIYWSVFLANWIAAVAVFFYVRYRFRCDCPRVPATATA
ncbi:MAG: MATE family efflux transporter [Geminicoccaceae bacterium]